MFSLCSWARSAERSRDMFPPKVVRVSTIFLFYSLGVLFRAEWYKF